jgi:3-hydroxyisobutyrate dehydrogenase-like beta-hydroxyacid dehydrogenase
MTTIALLYPGAVGRALADALAPFGHEFVTCLEGRGIATRDNASRSGIRALASLEEVASAADVAVSVVSPAAAREVAEHYTAAIRVARAEGHAPIYLDANSIAPRTAESIGEILDKVNVRFVDGVFMGPAVPISGRTQLALSGRDAPELASLFGPAMAVEVLGGRIGRASALKMSIALVTKALLALFLEMACAAEKSDCLDDVLREMRRSYGGTMEFLERNLPTFPKNAQRRLVEMHEAQAWLAGLGQEGALTAAATEVLRRIAVSGIGKESGDFSALLRRIVTLDPLAIDKD